MARTRSNDNDGDDLSSTSSRGARMSERQQAAQAKRQKEKEALEAAAEAEAQAIQEAKKRKASAAKTGKKAGGKKKKAKRSADNSLDDALRIRTPHPHDVLSGRGGGINAHPGNKQFREWIFERKNSYNLGRNKAAKQEVCQDIYDLIVSQNPPGRFLMREDQGVGRSGGPSLTSLSAIASGKSEWVEVGRNKAMAKISQALREGAPTIRAAAKKGKSKAEPSRSSGRKRKPKSYVDYDEDVDFEGDDQELARSRSVTKTKKKRDVVVGKTYSQDEDDIWGDPDPSGVDKRKSVFPRLEKAPVPAPISRTIKKESDSMPLTPTGTRDLLSPEEVAQAAAHFRHGTLIGTPGRGKEIVLPVEPPLIPTDGLPPIPSVTMTQPGTLRTHSGESRERRDKEDEKQGASANEQLTHVLHLDSGLDMPRLPTPPPHHHDVHDAHSYAQQFAHRPPQSSVLSPTPHLMPISPIISPDLFGSPVLSSPTRVSLNAHVPHPPLGIEKNGDTLNRSHSLALSDAVSGNGGIESHDGDLRNVFDDEERNVVHSPVAHSHHESLVALPGPPADLVNPEQKISPQNHVKHSDSRQDVTRSVHSTNSRQVSSNRITVGSPASFMAGLAQNRPGSLTSRLFPKSNMPNLSISKKE